MFGLLYFCLFWRVRTLADRCDVIVQVIAEGREKLAAVPSGGAVAVAAGGAAPAGGADEAKEEAKQEEPEEESEDEDMDGFSLFD